MPPPLPPPARTRPSLRAGSGPAATPAAPGASTPARTSKCSSRARAHHSPSCVHIPNSLSVGALRTLDKLQSRSACPLGACSSVGLLDGAPRLQVVTTCCGRRRTAWTSSATAPGPPRSARRPAGARPPCACVGGLCARRAACPCHTRGHCQGLTTRLCSRACARMVRVGLGLTPGAPAARAATRWACWTGAAAGCASRQRPARASCAWSRACAASTTDLRRTPRPRRPWTARAASTRTAGAPRRVFTARRF